MTELVSVEFEERGAVVLASFSGELDIAGAEEIGRRITSAIPAEARGVVLDFTDLSFLDSSGIGMLFGLARRLTDHRQELRIVVPDANPVARVLEIVEFGRAAPVHDTLDAALDGLEL